MNGATPPTTVAITTPSFCAQVAGVSAKSRYNNAGSLTAKEAVAVQPFAAVTVTEYVPPLRLPKSFGSLLPARCAQSKMNGASPPVIFKMIVPFALPLQVTLVTLAVIVGGAPWSTVPQTVVVHPLAPVTVAQ